MILEKLFYLLKFLKISNKKSHLQKTTRKKFLKKYDFLESILLHKIDFSKKSLLSNSKNEKNIQKDSKTIGKNFHFSKKTENPDDFFIQNFSEKKFFFPKTFLKHLFQTHSNQLDSNFVGKKLEEIRTKNVSKYFLSPHFFPQKKKLFQYWIFPLLGFTISTWHQPNFSDPLHISKFLFSRNPQSINFSKITSSKTQPDFSYKIFCERKEKNHIRKNSSVQIENFHNLYFYFLQKKIFLNPQSFYFPIQSYYFHTNQNFIQMFHFIGTKKDPRFFDIISKKGNFSTKNSKPIFEKKDFRNSKISPLSNYIQAKILFNDSLISSASFQKWDQLKKKEKTFLKNIEKFENFQKILKDFKNSKMNAPNLTTLPRTSSKSFNADFMKKDVPIGPSNNNRFFEWPSMDLLKKKFYLDFHFLSLLHSKVPLTSKVWKKRSKKFDFSSNFASEWRNIQCDFDKKYQNPKVYFSLFHKKRKINKGKKFLLYLMKIKNFQKKWFYFNYLQTKIKNLLYHISFIHFISPQINVLRENNLNSKDSNFFELFSNEQSSFESTPSKRGRMESNGIEKTLLLEGLNKSKNQGYYHFFKKFYVNDFVFNKLQQKDNMQIPLLFLKGSTLKRVFFIPQKKKKIGNKNVCLELSNRKNSKLGQSMISRFRNSSNKVGIEIERTKFEPSSLKSHFQWKFFHHSLKEKKSLPQNNEDAFSLSFFSIKNWNWSFFDKINLFLRNFSKNPKLLSNSLNDFQSFKQELSYNHFPKRKNYCQQNFQNYRQRYNTKIEKIFRTLLSKKREKSFSDFQPFLTVMKKRETLFLEHQDIKKLFLIQILKKLQFRSQNSLNMMKLDPGHFPLSIEIQIPRKKYGKIKLQNVGVSKEVQKESYHKKTERKWKYLKASTDNLKNHLFQRTNLENVKKIGFLSIRQSFKNSNDSPKSDKFPTWQKSRINDLNDSKEQSSNQIRFNHKINQEKYFQKKRRRKKLKLENRRRKKRKRFYPRSILLRYTLYRKFLNRRYNKNRPINDRKLQSIKKLGKNILQRNMRLLVDNFTLDKIELEKRSLQKNFLAKKLPIYLNKNSYNVSFQKFHEIMPLYWKSYWLRQNFQPYITRIRKNLKDQKLRRIERELDPLKESFFSNFLGFSLDSNKIGRRSSISNPDSFKFFDQTSKYYFGKKSLPFYLNKNLSNQKMHDFSFSNMQILENQRLIAEHDRILYDRISEIMKNVKFHKIGEHVSSKLPKSKYFKLPSNKKKPNNLINKFKSSMFEQFNPDFSFFSLFNRFSLKSEKPYGSNGTLRVLWAFNQTNQNFLAKNSIQKLWENITREQSKSNQTKKWFKKIQKNPSNYLNLIRTSEIFQKLGWENPILDRPISRQLLHLNVQEKKFQNRKYPNFNPSNKIVQLNSMTFQKYQKIQKKLFYSSNISNKKVFSEFYSLSHYSNNLKKMRKWSHFFWWSNPIPFSFVSFSSDFSVSQKNSSFSNIPLLFPSIIVLLHFYILRNFLQIPELRSFLKFQLSFIYKVFHFYLVSLNSFSGFIYSCQNQIKYFFIYSRFFVQKSSEKLSLKSFNSRTNKIVLFHSTNSFIKTKFHFMKVFQKKDIFSSQKMLFNQKNLHNLLRSNPGSYLTYFPFHSNNSNYLKGFHNIEDLFESAKIQEKSKNNQKFFHILKFQFYNRKFYGSLTLLTIYYSSFLFGTQTFQIFSKFFLYIIEVLENFLLGIYKFLEKPAELMIESIAHIFLIEWMSDICTFIPETLDEKWWESFQKSFRSLSFSMLYNNASFVPLSFLFLNNFKVLFFEFLESLLKPDMDIYSRQKKGIYYMNIWGEIFLHSLEKYQMNVSSLTTIAKEQEKFLEHLIKNPEIFEDYGRKRSLISKNFRIPKNLQRNSHFSKELFSNQKGNNSFLVLKRDNNYLSLLSNHFQKSNYSINQHVSTVLNNDLFLDIALPKSFLDISSFHFPISFTLGPILCEVYSGLFSKKVSKNILLITKKDEESKAIAFVQALAGEAEMKFIQDNAKRYAIHLSSTKLKWVFQSIAFQTPSCYLIENIHLIGEKRLLLEENTNELLGSAKNPAMNYPKSKIGKKQKKHPLSFIFKEISSSTEKKILVSRLQKTTEKWVMPPSTLKSPNPKKSPKRNFVLETPIMEKNSTIQTIRSKIAELADLSLKQFSRNVDMITDLLVIVDSVRSHRGFVVFATTHVPSILDPALRRPGRFDESFNFHQIQFKNQTQIMKKQKSQKIIFISSNFSMKKKNHMEKKGPPNPFLFSTIFPITNFFQLRHNEKYSKQSSHLAFSFFHPSNKRVCNPMDSNGIEEVGKNLEELSFFELREQSSFQQIVEIEKTIGKKTKMESFSRRKKLRFIFFQKIFELNMNFMNPNNLEFLEFQTQRRFKKPHLDWKMNWESKSPNREIRNNLKSFCNDPTSKIGSFFSSKNQSHLFSILASRIGYFLYNPNQSMEFPIRFSEEMNHPSNSFIRIPFFGLEKSSSFKEIQSLPFSEILMPVKKYEAWKRNEIGFQTKLLNSVNEKIQSHQKQRFLKKLYNQPLQYYFQALHFKKALVNQKFFDSNEVRRTSEFKKSNSQEKNQEIFFTPFINSFKELGSLSILVSSSTNSYYKTRFSRNQFSFINQWSNSQLPEHNMESTFLSDVDWRSMYVQSMKSSQKDQFIDFSDADQHYNAANRKWIFQNNFSNNGISNIFHYEIYYHFLTQSFYKFSILLSKNRELLDYFVFASFQNNNNRELYSIGILSRFFSI